MRKKKKLKKKNPMAKLLISPMLRNKILRNKKKILYRKLDQYSWQYCNKGFFNFKNYI